MNDTKRYDLIIVGTGAGGGTLARAAANAIRVGEHLLGRLGASTAAEPKPAVPIR